MINSFLFHEKCDNDVQQIMLELKKYKEDSIQKFKNELIITYQTIFEKPHIGQQIRRDWVLHNQEIRCQMLHNFPYGVIYKTFSERKVIILGIVSVDFYYRYRAALKKPV